MKDSAVYNHLAPSFRDHVDLVVAQVATLLWPERRAALEAFYRGIAQRPADELAAAVAALDLPTVDQIPDAELLFRVLLTACLERLGVARVTNHDQAVLYALSLDGGHVAAAEAWIARHPDGARPGTHSMTGHA